MPQKESRREAPAGTPVEHDTVPVTTLEAEFGTAGPAKSAVLGGKAVMALLWLLHWLPLPLLAGIGKTLAWLTWPLAKSRRRICRINLDLCFPELSSSQRQKLAKQHFGWLVRSLLERGLLMYASEARLRRLVKVTGDVKFGENQNGPVMWLLPHFVAIDFVAPALLLNQGRSVVDIYQKQSNPVFDQALTHARQRFGRTTLVDRHAGIRPVFKAIREGAGFVNAPDMDFGAKQSVFAPFFGVPAATLSAPGHMARSLGMKVQPIVMEILPWGRGYVAHFGEPIVGLDVADPMASATAMNLWLEREIRQRPAQYLWVHRRFKTRPPGQLRVY